MSGFGSGGNKRMGGFGPNGPHRPSGEQQQDISLDDIVAGVSKVASKAQAVAAAYASQYTSQWNKSSTGAPHFHVPRSLARLPNAWPAAQQDPQEAARAERLKRLLAASTGGNPTDEAPPGRALHPGPAVASSSSHQASGSSRSTAAPTPEAVAASLRQLQVNREQMQQTWDVVEQYRASAQASSSSSAAGPSRPPAPPPADDTPTRDQATSPPLDPVAATRARIAKLKARGGGAPAAQEDSEQPPWLEVEAAPRRRLSTVHINPEITAVLQRNFMGAFPAPNAPPPAPSASFRPFSPQSSTSTPLAPRSTPSPAAADLISLDALDDPSPYPPPRYPSVPPTPANSRANSVSLPGTPMIRDLLFFDDDHDTSGATTPTASALTSANSSISVPPSLPTIPSASVLRTEPLTAPAPVPRQPLDDFFASPHPPETSPAPPSPAAAVLPDFTNLSSPRAATTAAAPAAPPATHPSPVPLFNDIAPTTAAPTAAPSSSDLPFFADFGSFQQSAAPVQHSPPAAPAPTPTQAAAPAPSPAPTPAPPTHAPGPLDPLDFSSGPITDLPTPLLPPPTPAPPTPGPAAAPARPAAVAPIAAPATVSAFADDDWDAFVGADAPAPTPPAVPQPAAPLPSSMSDEFDDFQSAAPVPAAAPAVPAVPAPTAAGPAAAPPAAAAAAEVKEKDPLADLAMLF